MTAPEQARPDRAAVRPVRSIAQIVMILVGVEVASGFIQGYYGPVLVDIADRVDVGYADLNWLEAAQLLFSALVVPPLARLGDIVGHRRVLLMATGLTAAATWGIAFAPSYPMLLVAWTLQGVYVVWLPIEVVIIHRRTAGRADQHRMTRRVAAVLVAVLEVSLILAAVVSGQVADRMSLTAMLALPAVAVTLCLPALWFLTADRPVAAARFDWRGLGLLVLALLTTGAGLVLIRLQERGALLGWLLVVAGLAALLPWWRFEARQPAPLVDVRTLRRADQWSIQATSFLLGISLLGAQVPLQTYFRSDPAVTGFGFGLSAAQGASRLALYVTCLAVGALLLPRVSRLLGPRGAMAAGALTFAGGYAGWLPLHASLTATWLLLALMGLGAGALVAGIPAAAAATAPSERVGSAAGLTNATKALGGAAGSSVFAILLSNTGTVRVDHGSLSGYFAVWSICAVSGVVAALVLVLTPNEVSDDPADPVRSPVR